MHEEGDPAFYIAEGECLHVFDKFEYETKSMCEYIERNIFLLEPCQFSSTPVYHITNGPRVGRYRIVFQFLPPSLLLSKGCYMLVLNECGALTDIFIRFKRPDNAK